MRAHGIVLYNQTPSILTLDLTIARGSGEIYVDGLVTEEFERIYRQSFSAVCDLIDHGEIPDTDFSGVDINFSLSHSLPGIPIEGDSYGLLVGLSLALSLGQLEPNPELCITGALGEDGRVLPVGAIEEKRRGAKALGFGMLMLPSTQLDFFSQDIDQLPVATIYEAWAVCQYG